MDDFVGLLKSEAENYWAVWSKFDTFNDLFEHIPSTIGWKTENIDEFNAVISYLLKNALVSQCHIGHVDNRFIASIVFTEPIFKNIQILKLMQRRPGSTDPVGLDHIDFYTKDLGEVEKQLTSMNIEWASEHNDSHNWISLRFDKHEAKLVDHLVLDVCVKELRDVSKSIGFEPVLLS